MSITEAIGTSSAFVIANQENIHQWLQLFRDLVQRNGLSRFINPSVLERNAAQAEHVDPSARPENAGPTWISIDAFKASELAKNPGASAEAREKRELIVLHLVVLYKEACAEFQRRQKSLDVMLTWLDHSVPAGQRGLIFASIDRMDIYSRSEIIKSRFMSTHQNGLVNCISTLLDIKVKRDHMAGIHSMLDESSNVMVRIRKHIADGALDILDVLHTMVLLRALPSSFSILVVALSGV